ncbi:MFS transporter [Micromonospora sp. SH-82]|uniref:MFS transporter n=1 Tax=Micromonospora sp. SH-82 TaxID=3132938 RepID=UPI003EBBF8BF
MVSSEVKASPLGPEPAHPTPWTRWATAAAFLVTGLVLASYFVRVPSLKIKYGFTDGELGLFFVLPVVTGLFAMQATGNLVARFGSAPIIRVTMVGLPLSLAGIGFADNRWQFALALLLFGIFDGLIDVSMNAHAVTVERALRRPIMNSCHAGWSIGAMAGAALGALAIKADLSPTRHFLLICGALLLLGLFTGRHLLPAAADRSEGYATEAKPKIRWYEGWTPRVVLLGVTGTVVLVAEGAVGNWGGVFLHDELGATLATASLGYLAFSVFQAAGRLVGDRIQERVGAGKLIRWGGVVAVVGLSIVVLSPVPSVAVAGFAVLGVGMSVLVPLIMSAVGHSGAESGDNAAAALAKVQTLTYSGMLLGPVLVGWSASGIGLTLTLAVLLGVLALTLVTGLRRI